MRCNVDLLKIIQMGITLSDANGNQPPDICTWQFNFHFSLEYVSVLMCVESGFILTASLVRTCTPQTRTSCSALLESTFLGIKRLGSVRMTLLSL